MALLTCPECGRKVSEEASACPGCGYPVDKMIGLQTPESQKKLGNGLGVAGFVVSIVALLFSYAASLGFILGVVAFGLAFSGLLLAIVKGNRAKGLAIAGLVISIVAIACVFEQNINNASTIKDGIFTKSSEEDHAFASPLSDAEKTELAATLDSIEPVQPEEDAQKEMQIATTPSITKGQKNALKKAKEYFALSAFSHSGIIRQLKFEGFTTDEATFAADNCGMDWNEQAAKKAEEYLLISSFSRNGLIRQLKYEGFTQEQAEYGVNAVGY